jgi:tetratricopeptide (TPR) repeat protein
MALNRYSEAITCSDQILKLFPQNADALNNRGVCLMALERYAEAIDCFEKALKLSPNDADIFINKGFEFLLF